MFELLLEGKGDVVAASLPTNFLQQNDLVQYTKPYDYVSPVVVGRNTGDLIIDVRDFAGKRISLSRDNPYWNYISRLKKQGLNFELIEANTENIETIMLKVAFGIYDFTITGNHQIRFNHIERNGFE